jgi:hypothetical protein
MDPGQLLDVPMASNPAFSKFQEEARERGVAWG